MKITVIIKYSGEGSNAREFAEEMEKSGVADKIRAEKGNLRYEYFLPLDDSEAVLLIDSWESQQALDIHHASPMMADIARLRKKYDLHMTAEKYTQTENEGDEKFIRK